MTTTALFNRFRELSLEISHLGAAEAVLSWDQHVMMRPKSDAARSDVLGTMAVIAHERRTSAEYERTLTELVHRIDELDAPQASSVQLAWKKFSKAKRMPAKFVKELTELTASGQAVWAAARKDDDFEAFRPTLERIVAMKREETTYCDPAASPYTCLLEEFEPGMTAEKAAAVLGDLRAFLVPFVARIAASGMDARPEIARIAAPLETQAALEQVLAQAMGFDLEAGRIDITTHPFCTGFHPSDVRITTRRDPQNMLDSLYSVAHEAGHGLYEQGLPVGLFGLPAGSFASMGLHESQSRLWENMVAKSPRFWVKLRHELGRSATLPQDGLSSDSYWRAVNAVKPSFIRVESDEATYNLHICLRVEIERDLIEGKLDVKDVREAWNAKMREYLGVEVVSDAQGVLQDVHWSAGAFGYFPTYAIGNIYSAQLFAAACRDIPGLEDGFSEWRFGPLLEWLRDRVHRHGSVLPADEIVRRATGSGLDAAPFKTYLEKKFGAIYGI